MGFVRRYNRAMYWPDAEVKKCPERRWHRPDRIFFAHGACHILAGVFLADPPAPGFHGEWIVPQDGFPGNHIYVTNGQIAFDFHGYSVRERMISRYWAAHRDRYPGWAAEIVKIDFPLLDTAALNARNHLGPDQFFGDPCPRARRFIAAKKCPPDLRLA